ncbi:MAG: Crp/Fnr family transcriptional regulator [Thermomicrobiales bacterium]
MKFAVRDGGTARTLAVTAPGWYRGDVAAPSHVAAPARAARSSQMVQTPARQRRSRAVTESYAKGQEIFGPGQGLGMVYIVRTGCVRLYKTLSDGRSINVGLIGPNMVFTQEDPSNELSSGSIAEALVDTTLSIVDRDGLAAAITDNPELAYSLVNGMNRSMTELQTLAEQLLARDTSVRLATTLLSLSRWFGRPMADGSVAISEPVTHQQLANMIGSNRVTVTRKLAEMQERGLVRSMGRNSIAVTPEALLVHVRAASEASEAGF